MATLQAATASDGAIVSDPEAVRDLCENYYLEQLNWEISEDGEFRIWGPHDLTIRELTEDGDPAGATVTRHWLRELSEYIVPGGELDIQTAGFTKCRFPVLAKRYVVRHGEVLHTDLSGLKPIDDHQGQTYFGVVNPNPYSSGAEAITFARQGPDDAIFREPEEARDARDDIAEAAGNDQLYVAEITVRALTEE